MSVFGSDPYLRDFFVKVLYNFYTCSLPFHRKEGCEEEDHGGKVEEFISWG